MCSSMYAYVCILCMFVCMWRPEVNIRCPPQLFSALLFETHLFLNLGLTHSSGLAGQQTLKDPFGFALSVLGLHTLGLHAYAIAPGFFTCYMRNQTGNCVASASLTKPSHIFKNIFLKAVTQRNLILISASLLFPLFIFSHSIQSVPTQKLQVANVTMVSSFSVFTNDKMSVYIFRWYYT